MMQSVEQRWRPIGATDQSGAFVHLLAASFARATVARSPEPITLTHVETRTDFKELFMHEKDDRTVLTAIDARGARLGRPMLVMLIVSTLTVIGIFSLLYYGTYG
jgi:hypothetical protein